jgi:hypothetical protein
MKAPSAIVLIHPFSSLHRPLTPEERANLHADLDKNGILAPLIVWAQPRLNRILLDGHNRFAWAKERGIEPPVRELAFENQDDALRWAIANQLARRNLTPEESRLLRGRLYNLEKKAVHDGGKGKERSGSQNGDHFSSRTCDRLARQHGVSKNTIVRDGEFAAAVDTIAATVPEAASVIASGQTGLGHGVIVEMAERLKVDPDLAVEIRERITAASSRTRAKPARPDTGEPETDEKKKARRIQEVRVAYGSHCQHAIALRKFGRERRQEFWNRNAEAKAVYREGLQHTVEEFTGYLGEIE